MIARTSILAMKRDAGGFKDYVAPEISTSRKERTWEGVGDLLQKAKVFLRVLDA